MLAEKTAVKVADLRRLKKNRANKVWSDKHRAEIKSRVKNRVLNGQSNHDHRKYKYGITKEQFEERIKFQNNSCAICESRFTETPNIDHDYVTGKNRGLLCSSCNYGLGCFKDNPVFLRKAAAYTKSIWIGQISATYKAYKESCRVKRKLWNKVAN